MNAFGVNDDLARACRAMLDKAAVAAVLNRTVAKSGQAAGTVSDLRVQRVWPARDGGVVVEWSFVIESPDRCTLFGVVAGTDPGGPPLDAEQVCASAPHVVDGVLYGVDIYVPELCLRILSSDRDPGMPHVARCLDPVEMCHAISSLAPPQGVVRDFEDISSCALLGYRLGRRATIAYDLRLPDGTRRRVIGKTFRDDRGRQMLDRLGGLRAILTKDSHGRVTVPEPLGYLPDYHMALCADVPRGADAMHAVDEACPPMAIEALASLHRVDLGDLPRFGVADEMRIVGRWESLVRSLRPDPSAPFRRLAEELPGLAQKISSAEARVIHRDFYREQLLFGAQTCAILDLDTLALGDPCVDIGNLVAHSLLYELERGGAVQPINVIADEIVGAYRTINGSINDEAMTFFLATSLCRLGAVHAFRSATGRFAEPLWQAAVTIIESSKTNHPAAGRSSSGSKHAALGKALRQEVAP